MSQHATAPAREIEVKTPQVEPKLGITPAAMPGPRPDLAGLRVKLPTQPQIYLIDPDGYRRWIPNPVTYNNLFRDWNNVVVDIAINEIPESSALTDGAILARADGAAPVYLISNGIKRWITSPAAMDKYYFSWDRVYVLPHVMVDFIVTGPSWS